MMEVVVFGIIVLVFAMGGILYLLVSSVYRLILFERKERMKRCLPKVIFTCPTTTSANQEDSMVAFLDGFNATDLMI